MVLKSLQQNVKYLYHNGKLENWHIHFAFVNMTNRDSFPLSLENYNFILFLNPLHKDGFELIQQQAKLIQKAKQKNNVSINRKSDLQSAQQNNYNKLFMM